MEGYEFTVCVAHQAEHIENPGQKQENTCNTEHIFEGYLLDVKPNGIFPAGHVSEDSIACHLTLQYNGTTGDRNVIKSENMSDIDEAEEPFNVVTIKPELDYNTVGKGDETNLLECDSKCEVEDAILVFGTKREPFQNSLDDHVEQFEFVSVPSPLSENKRLVGKLQGHLDCTETAGAEEDFAGNQNLQEGNCDECSTSKLNLRQHQKWGKHLKPHLKCLDSSRSSSHKYCFSCDKTFTLKQHPAHSQEMTQQVKVSPYKCFECHQSFTAKRSLERHRMSAHLKLKLRQDKRCEHLKPHVDRGRSLTIKRKLKFHRMSQHLNRNSHKCSSCDEKFPSKQHLNDHQMTKHLRVKSYKCFECHKSFTVKRSLERHRTAEHLKLKPHKCIDCEKSFARKDYLDSHRNAHHLKLDRHKCPICDKSFASKQTLYWHETSQHLEPKAYKCFECDQSYPTKITLERHQMLQHWKLKPHECLECGKSYTEKRNLKYHQMSQHLKQNCPKRHKTIQHLRATAYECRDCGESFTRKGNLKHHQLSRHLKLKPHKCPECDKSFTTKQNLERHGMTLHLKLKPYKCPDCDKSYTEKRNLKCHQLSHHLKLTKPTNATKVIRQSET